MNNNEEKLPKLNINCEVGINGNPPGSAEK